MPETDDPRAQATSPISLRPLPAAASVSRRIGSPRPNSVPLSGYHRAHFSSSAPEWRCAAFPRRFECIEKRKQVAKTGRKRELYVTYQLFVIACQYSRPSTARPNMAPCLLIDGIDSGCLLCAIAGQVDVPDAERMARVRSETPELRSNDCAPRPCRSPMPAHGPAHTRGAERPGHARWTTRRTSGRHRPIRR